MKNLITLFLMVLLVVGCQQAAQPSIDNHMGCTVEEQGKGCQLAEKNNADLFGRSYAGVVSTAILSSPDVIGFLAKPTAQGKYPGIVMVHEWWGLNDNIREMAQLLASEGYVVFAVDLYGEVATTPERAGALAGGVRSDQASATKKLRVAVSYLRSLPEVNGRIGSIGWCFGGGQSLQLALSGEKLDATVIYYGQLTDDKDQLRKISWPVLGIFGEADQVIPVDSVRKFGKVLDGLGIENSINIYPGVGHAFANPSGAQYAANETRDAWAKTTDFFQKALKQ